MRIIISGGKTGGHLIPGIALYSEAKARKHQVWYFLGPHDDRFAITSRIAKEDKEIVPLSSLSRQLSWKTPLWMVKIFGAFFVTIKKILQIKPDAVIITGGYISNPVALSALVLGIPLYILEQNTIAGMTNRWFAPFARKVFTSFPETEKIPPKKVFFTGNPSIFANPLPRKEARDFFHIPHDSLCLGVIGGSQGALKLNEAIQNLLPFFREREIFLLWSVGESTYTYMQKNGLVDFLQANNPHLKIFPFIERMDAFWGACDGVIARSGATTVAEVIMACCPALFVPIYRSPDDHQKKNALSLVKEGGADLVEEPMLHTLPSRLENFLNSLPKKRKALEKLRSSYPSTPEKRILSLIEKEITEEQHD